MSQIILFDLPSKDRCACWSYNPWKIRLALNFKGIDYKTEWLEYPDIAAKFKSFGIPPNKKGAEYTIPAVRLADGTYLMDSLQIAGALEMVYPTPSLHLDWEKLQDVIEKNSATIGNHHSMVESKGSPHPPLTTVGRILFSNQTTEVQYASGTSRERACH